MTQFLMSVYDDGSEYPADEMQTIYDEVEEFNDQLRANGTWVFGGGLEPVGASATVVDATGSDVINTDGPYVETKEYIGGFWIIEAPDMDAALQIAAGASKACRGPVEVRAFQDEPGS